MPEFLIAAKGVWGRVLWAQGVDGKASAMEFFKELSVQDQAKVVVLFQRMADLGTQGLQNREKFKSLGKCRSESLFEFKSFQLRFLGAYRPGSEFVVAHGLRKKSDDLPPQALEIAARILKEHDAYHSPQRKGRP